MTTPHTPGPPNPSGPESGGPDPLGARLAALTEWRAGEPALHAEALRRVRVESAGGQPAGESNEPRHDVLARLRRPRVIVPAAAAALLVLVAAAQAWFGGAASSHRRAASPQGVSSFSDPNWSAVAPAEQTIQKGFGPAADQAPAPDASLPGDRSVIHKASIEIVSKNVRADFARAGLLVSDAQGEFIEASSLTGEGVFAQGTLTLRVKAQRVSDVLNALRELGTVATEKSSGDDVTEQVVDIAARLRNEQKVEDELLKLLDTRKGAPLKEILDLREQVAKVRERIEQMAAQQERITKSVALATILVILRPEPALPAHESEQTNQSALDYFGDRLGGAWHAGTRALADSAAGVVRALVGGLVWWSLLGAGVIAWLRWMREAPRRAAQEAAPAV